VCVCVWEGFARLILDEGGRIRAGNRFDGRTKQGCRLVNESA
jgi:hypothetical protein